MCCNRETEHYSIVCFKRERPADPVGQYVCRNRPARPLTHAPSNLPCTVVGLQLAILNAQPSVSPPPAGLRVRRPLRPSRAAAPAGCAPPPPPPAGEMYGRCTGDVREIWGRYGLLQDAHRRRRLARLVYYIRVPPALRLSLSLTLTPTLTLSLSPTLTLSPTLGLTLTMCSCVSSGW